MLKRQLPDSLPKNIGSGYLFFFLSRSSVTLAIFLCFVAPFFSSLYASTQVDLHVLRSDITGVTFEYVPTPVRHDTVSLSGETFDLLSIDQCTLTSEPGHPQLPKRYVLIGLPPGARPSVTVLEAPFRSARGYRLAPAPRMDTDGLSYALDQDAYSSNTMRPVNRLTVDTPGMMRGHSVLPIALSPVAYSPADGRVRLYDRIRVDIRFNASEITTPLSGWRGPDRLNSVFEQSVLNARTAAAWQRLGTANPPATRISPFGPGTWYKVNITEDGMYRINRQLLQDTGINVDGLDPHNMRMFHGGGRVLPQDVDSPRPSLKEIAIQVEGEADGRFDENDHILFYGTALHGWDFLQTLRTYLFFNNPYTDTNVYWLSIGGTIPGKRMGIRDGRIPGGVTQIDTPVRRREEREILNPINSGTTWFWQLFDGAFREEVNFAVDLGNVARSGQVTARFRFQSKTRFAHHVQVFINNTFVGERIWSGESVSVELSETGNWLQDGVNEIRIVLPRNNSTANQPDHVYFDWFEFAYRAPMDASEGTLTFEQDLQAAGPFVRYQVSSAPADAATFDITDPFQVTQMTTEFGSGFRDSVRTIPTQYILVTPEQGKQPVSLFQDADSDLRNVNNGADYIIVAHDSFIDAAEKLGAHRTAYSGMRVTVAKTSDIYDEFSWGLFDPTAIRDFLRYAGLNWSSGSPPAFALLLGDGNFDYKNHSRNSPGLWVPPFEQGDRCTDDWFVYFDGNGDPLVENDIFPDMAIGRLPAQLPVQADIMVRKIIDYESAPEFGVWRNTIVLTADDENTPGSTFAELFHTTDSERLADRHLPRSFRAEKVYLTQFPLDAAGEKPGARDALINHINDGVLLVNWVGHGAANLWAHERVFNTSRDLPSLNNGNKLPVFVTATCTAGRFDLVTEEAMAEDFLRVEGKGAVGFVGATRLSFPHPNAVLNRALFDGMFQQNLTIGEALLQAKIRTVDRTNSEKYIYFGDPAMRIGKPKQAIRFTEVVDTLRVLHVAEIQGEVLQDSTIDRSFSGSAFVRTSDSAQEVTYTASLGGQAQYLLPGADVFRGTVSVDQGQFSASFIVPRDITYGGNQGRIAVYATDGRSDAAGVIERLPLRGADPAFQDSTGPEIEVLVDGRPFTDEDYTSPKPTLTINLFDESGINITGEVGHQITVQTDRDVKTRQDVTSRFTYDNNSFTRGSLQVQLPTLTAGDHPLTIKAWDNFNNSATTSLIVSIVEDMDLRITDVMNYPNPFDGPTTFTYQLTQDADITIQIYTVAGTRVQRFDLIGFRGFNQIDWDGLDQDSDRLANGVYLYKITARSHAEERKTTAIFGRLLVVQ